MHPRGSAGVIIDLPPVRTMQERPHYSKTTLITAAVIKRKMKPRHHSFSVDYRPDLGAFMDSVESARAYNGKKGEFLDSVMVIFYGKTKGGEERTSASPLVMLDSTNNYIYKLAEKALHKLQQSDASAKFMRIVYDVLKENAAARAQKSAASSYVQARNLNEAKKFGFTNFKDYNAALKMLNKKYKHGATEKSLKREALKIAKQKQKTKGKK